MHALHTAVNVIYAYYFILWLVTLRTLSMNEQKLGTLVEDQQNNYNGRALYKLVEILEAFREGRFNPDVDCLPNTHLSFTANIFGWDADGPSPFVIA